MKINITHVSNLKSAIGIFAIAAMLSACSSQRTAHVAAPSAKPATAPISTTTSAAVKVEYSQTYLNGYRLYEIPTEVTLVNRDITAKVIMREVVKNALTLVIGGFANTNGFGKEDFKGIRIDDVNDRANLKNPAPTQFVVDLQNIINRTVQEDATYKEKAYSRPLVVAGGEARLIYEELGNNEERFRLKMDLSIYKRPENAKFFTFNPKSIHPDVVVNCYDASPEPLLRSEWAQNDYQLVRTQLDAMLATCQKKVLAELPDLLKQ